MGWARFDDAYTDHPKVVEAGPLAELLDMRAIIYCARYETDGHVTTGQLARLTVGISAPKKRIAELIRVGRWHEPGHDCADCPSIETGYQVHGYLEFNPSRSEKDEEREKARDRMRKAREQKGSPSGGNNGRSSHDVRPNTGGNNGRSSGNPDPSPPQDQEQPPLDSPPKKPAKERKAKRPADWQVNDTHRRIASEERVDCDREAVKFCDHHDSKGSRFVDWDKAFCTWLRNARDFGAAEVKQEAPPRNGDVYLYTRESVRPR